MFYILLFSLLALSLVHSPDRQRLTKRNYEDWILDAASLGSHFLLLPLVQGVVVYQLFSLVAPQLKGTLSIGWPVAILANMLIDYGWYWNHRLFHAQTPFWKLHELHHATERLDILATARNSFWSPFFMVYFWLQPLMIFLAKDPIPFLSVAGFGLLVNFWGHTQLDLPRGSRLRKILSGFLIQPEDHFWHHSAENSYCNFATVFNFWDRLHGTWHHPNHAPEKIGFKFEQPLWRKIFFPA